jgi:Zn-dependent protease
MPKCYHCGEEYPPQELIQCISCGQYYCFLHKEPIDHECNLIRESASFQQVHAPRPTYREPTQVVSNNESSMEREGVSSVVRGTTDGSYTWYRQERSVPENAFDPDSGIEFKGILFPYKSEILHLLIGASLIFIIGLIIFYSSQLIRLNLIWAIFLLAGFYATAFLFHEFGHRQVAKHFGFQTKFRLLTFGMIITIFSLIAGLFSLASDAIRLPILALPGAVVVLGLDKIDRTTGLCKAAGPVVNLIYGTILLIISFVIPKSLFPLNLFIGYASALNFMLALFNMIPIGILDGQNIWKWNKSFYIILMVLLILLLIIVYANIYAPIQTSLYVPENMKVAAK